VAALSELPVLTPLVLAFLKGDGSYPGKKGFEFLAPLVAEMTQEDPSKRPTMDIAMVQFEEIRRGLSSWKLRSRIVERHENTLELIYYGVSHWI
jgi:hypothetical protein